MKIFVCLLFIGLLATECLAGSGNDKFSFTVYNKTPKNWLLTRETGRSACEKHIGYWDSKYTSKIVNKKYSTVLSGSFPAGIMRGGDICSITYEPFEGDEPVNDHPNFGISYLFRLFTPRMPMGSFKLQAILPRGLDYITGPQEIVVIDLDEPNSAPLFMDGTTTHRLKIENAMDGFEAVFAGRSLEKGALTEFLHPEDSSPHKTSSRIPPGQMSVTGFESSGLIFKGASGWLHFETSQINPDMNALADLGGRFFINFDFHAKTADVGFEGMGQGNIAYGFVADGDDLKVTLCSDVKDKICPHKAHKYDIFKFMAQEPVFFKKLPKF